MGVLRFINSVWAVQNPFDEPVCQTIWVLPKDFFMEFHKYSNFFPLLDDKKIIELAYDIDKNGLQFPIVTYEGGILDGRNRYRACQHLGIEAATVPYEGDKPLEYVVSLNLHRRHLSESQRAMVAANIANLDEGRPKNNASIEAVSQADAAEMLNVSRSGVQRAAKVKEYGVPELAESVEQGEISVSRASEIASLPPEQQQKSFVQHNTGNNEWYTPPDIIAFAKKAMGYIYLDPASSDIANRLVKSEIYYTKEDDGLTKSWEGNVWMNPPYASGLIDKFTSKLVAEYEDGKINQACVLVNNATETRWFQEMLNICAAVCFIKGRVKFVDMDGVATGAPLQGQAILYMGGNRANFVECFKNIGVVL